MFDGDGGCDGWWLMVMVRMMVMVMKGGRGDGGYDDED